jgi:uncharacterized protein YbjQ (UPF0145 family)
MQLTPKLDDQALALRFKINHAVGIIIEFHRRIKPARDVAFERMTRQINRLGDNGFVIMQNDPRW